MRKIEAVIKPFELGAGKLFVFPAQEVVRSRAGERGIEAL